MAKQRVPEGMLEAAMRASMDTGLAIGPSTELLVPLEAALRWQSENPPVPTDEQAKELWHRPRVLGNSEPFAKVITRDWIRMMYAEPEVPEAVRDLLFLGDGKCLVERKQEVLNAKILEAYERGKGGK